MKLKSRVYKRGNRWLVDTPQFPSMPMQLFNWQHAMELANEYATLAQFSAQVDTGPSWRELQP